MLSLLRVSSVAAVYFLISLWLESADEDIQQDFKFCVKTHKRKILMFQMELVAVSKEFCKIKNNVKDDNLKLFEGKVLALEQWFPNFFKKFP